MDIDMAVYHGELRARQRHADARREARAAAGVYSGLPSVPRLLAARDVLVTGGSGFLGRVLVEKLLRTCPDIGTIFLLLRPKRGVAPEQRIADVIDSELFDLLRQEQPKALSKLVPVAGDCSELGLGLAAEDRAMLQDRVFIVFHGAASVRFDDPLQKAVLLNTRGTREVASLCAGMRQLKALVYISTAYTNTNQEVVEERLYPADLDWRKVISAVQDDDTAATMDLLGRKVLGFHPNSYAFSKALAEQVMAEAAATLPVVIVRPDVVIGTCNEDPLIGWQDNLNSPTSLWAALSMGVIRVCPLFGKDSVIGYVPVDTVTKATIVAAWATATQQWSSKEMSVPATPGVPVVNVSITDVHPVPGSYSQDIYETLVKRGVPFGKAIRYPVFIDTQENRLLYGAIHLVYHLMFGVVMDGLLRLAGQKPRLIKVYRKIQTAITALLPFTSKHHAFQTSRFWELQRLMHPEDLESLNFDLDSLDPRKDAVNLVQGVLKYAMKENFDKEKGLRHIDRLFWMELGFHLFLIAVLIYLFAPI